MSGLVMGNFITSIFCQKGVVPPGIQVSTIYRGVTPFILLQLTGLGIIFGFERIVTWLPEQAYGP